MMEVFFKIVIEYEFHGKHCHIGGNCSEMAICMAWCAEKICVSALDSAFYPVSVPMVH